MQVSMKLTDKQIRGCIEELVFSQLPEHVVNDVESHVHIKFKAVCYDKTEIDLSKEAVLPYHLEVLIEGRTFEDEGD